jgi:hypothetical protein
METVRPVVALALALAAVMLLAQLSAAVYRVYNVTGIRPAVLSQVETSYLGVLGTWLPWVVALLAVAALLYTAFKRVRE